MDMTAIKEIVDSDNG